MNNKNNIKVETVIVALSWDESGSRDPILIVGKKNRVGKHAPDIINAFSGEEAFDIFNKLIEKKKDVSSDSEPSETIDG